MAPDLPVEGDDDGDDRLVKTGPDLFRELLRIYPVADVEDYWKAGQWKDDLMRTDLRLIEAHRMEAGAADPPPLDEVKMPEMPKVPPAVAAVTARPQLSLGGAPMAVVRGAAPPAGVVAVAGRAAPVALAPPAGVAGGAAAGAAGSQVAELRLIALFVAKWKLDATRTKLVLNKLPPDRRRYVIQNFKTPAQGEDALKALDKYVAECERSQAWGPLKAAPVAGSAPAVSTAASGVPVPVGVKRPFGVVMPASQDPNKRSALASPLRPALRPGAPAQVGVARPAMPVQVGVGRPVAPAQVGMGRPVGALAGGVRLPGGRPPVVVHAPRPPVVVNAPRPGLVAHRQITPGQRPAAQGALVRGLLQKF